MEKRRCLLLLGFMLCAFFMVIPSAFSQILTGEWTLNAAALLPNETVPCQYEGGGSTVEQEGTVTGLVSITRVSGPFECPPQAAFDLLGTRNGIEFSGMLEGGQMFGGWTFSSSVNIATAVIAGTFTALPGGPFEGTTGTFVAANLNGSDAFAVPALSSVGLLLLAGLLIYIGCNTLRRRRPS